MNGVDDLYEMIDRDADQTRRRTQRRDEERRQRSEWDNAWQEVVCSPSVTVYLELGRQLNAGRYGLWLEVCQARARSVLERNLQSGYAFLPAKHGFSCLAIRLLKFAFIGDADSIAAEMQRAREKSVMGHLCEITHDLREEAELWSSSGYRPLTPYISRSELATALRRRLKGLGNPSGINRAIHEGRLEIEIESRPAEDGKTRYARFRHRDPARHPEMLRLAVEQLKKQQNDISFFGPFWTAESGEWNG